MVTSTAGAARRARIRIAAGPLATERLLLEEIDGRLAELGLEALRTPVRVVVPSHSLRDHLRARIVEHRGGAAAGVACQTLHSLALEIIERGEEPPALNEQLLYLAAERLARREEPLRRALDHLADGYPAVGRTVRDLLDAGLDPAHVEALEDALREEGAHEAGAEEIGRACSLVRVAAGVRQWMEAAGAARTSSLLERAGERVRADADRALAPGALLVYGFEDATGVATDLLYTLLSVYGGEVFIDHPADPAARDRADPGVVFTRRFVERLEGVARRETVSAPPSAGPGIRMFRAIGAEAEAREVARRLRHLLDRGARPEATAVVARRLEPYRAPLRTQLSRLGIPFSALDAPGPLGADGRRLAALLHLLDRGVEARVERWLDALGRPFRGIATYDLRLALFRLGAARLGEARGLRLDGLLERGSLPLPVRQGFVADAEDPEAVAYLLRRRVRGSALARAIEAAVRLCDRLEKWSEVTRLSLHVGELERLLRRDLRTSPGASVAAEVAAAVGEATRGLAGDLQLSFGEFVDLLRPALDARGATGFGGSGSGVQILEVVEARSRTFEHLFVIGLNRGVFPRSVREDPLLPDALRGVLARQGFGPLQDLPLKLGGFDEERYLFAQLLGAAPEITLSWLAVDDDNLELACSPLVERLRWGRAGRERPDWREPPTARHLFSARADALAGDEPRPAYESSVLAGLLGERSGFRGVLALALEEAEEGGRAAGAAARAAARVRVLDEMDPPRGGKRGEAVRRRLGPYHGFVGPAGSRPGGGGRLYITTLENLAACPWQLFLERVLRLAPTPDPLEALPGVEPLLIGGLVHRVLERLVEERLGPPPETLQEALAGSPAPVPWPDGPELDRLLEDEARALVRREGIGLPGFARALAAVARPYLAVARRVDWQELRGPRVYAAEAVGSLEVADSAGVARPIHFKVDRADRGPRGLDLTDYKTGRSFAGDGTARTRQSALLQAVRSGERLQAVAYALAGGGAEDRGRYLFLRPDAGGDEEARQIVARADDEALVEAFREAAAIALDAWDRGSFFPRLVEPARDEEPRRCSFCRVAEACLRGDSSTRLRLADWARGRGEPPTEPIESAWLSLWRLAAGTRRRR